MEWFSDVFGIDIFDPRMSVDRVSLESDSISDLGGQSDFQMGMAGQCRGEIVADQRHARPTGVTHFGQEQDAKFFGAIERQKTPSQQNRGTTPSKRSTRSVCSEKCLLKCAEYSFGRGNFKLNKIQFSFVRTSLIAFQAGPPDQ